MNGKGRTSRTERAAPNYLTTIAPVHCASLKDAPQFETFLPFAKENLTVDQYTF
jgi:hypothetical protein